MSDKLNAEALEGLSVEEILELSVDQIEEMSFDLYPAGLYAGNLDKWDLPDDDNNQSFVPHVNITSVIELANPDAEYVLKADAKVSSRYGIAYGNAIRGMRTDWADFFTQIGEGSLGRAMAGGNGTQLTFEIKHRLVKSKDAEGKPTGESRTYMDIKNVKVA